MCHRDVEDAFVELVVYGLYFTFRLFHHASPGFTDLLRFGGSHLAYGRLSKRVPFLNQIAGIQHQRFDFRHGILRILYKSSCSCIICFSLNINSKCIIE